MAEDGTFDNEPASGPDDHNLPSAYEVLLRQYRESLARIHGLEMEVRNLTNMVMQPAWRAPSTSVPGLAPPIETGAIIARLEALENRSNQVDLARPETNAADAEESPAMPAEDQVAQLRVQNHSLASRLARVTEQLDEIRRGRSTRRRRDSGRHRQSSNPGRFKRLLGG